MTFVWAVLSFAVGFIVGALLMYVGGTGEEWQ